MQKILIIDDEIDLCDLIAELAEDAGLEVRTLNDSSAVAETLIDFKPDALMLDLMMPGTDGVELLRTHSETLKNIKIALMSGSDSRVLNSARRLGSAHGLDIITTLEKPLEISLIRETLKALTSNDAAAPAPVTAVNLSQAIAEKQMNIVVQPIVDLHGNIASIEILPRWLQPDGTELPAESFIEKARADGLLGQLTQDLLEKSLVAARQMEFEATIAFNIMPEQLHDPYFATRLVELATTHNVPLKKIALELSELPLRATLIDLLPTLADLRDRGAQIWLNDYAGKMSLADLMQLPLAGMKLSRHLVMGLPNNLAETTITGAIALANMRQLPVYAVAVETAAQQELLIKLGISGYQGKLVAPPMNLDVFAGWLAGRRSSLKA